MSDDKPRLTRRKALMGLGTIGAAGTVGAGTWAKFTDEERKNVSVEAGSLDLQFKDFHPGKQNDWGDWKQGPVNVDLGTFGNGQKKYHCELVKNAGSVSADEITVELPYSGFSQRENGRTEPERDAGDTDGEGDLKKFLTVSGFFVCEVDGGYEVKKAYGAKPSLKSESDVSGLTDFVSSSGNRTSLNHIAVDQLGPVRLEDALGKEKTVDLGGAKLGSGDTCLFCLSVELTEPDGYTTADIAQTDELRFAADVAIAQNS